MTMQAKDLMIGDWVNYHDDDKIVPKQVSEITNYKQLQLHDKSNWIIVGEKYCEPIPLTAEILEKNGFVHRQSVTWGDIFTYTYAIIQKDKVLQYEQYFNLSPHPYDGSGFYWIPEMSAVSALLVVYVHELQHLLRLCGIDKEINL